MFCEYTSYRWQSINEDTLFKSIIALFKMLSKCVLFVLKHTVFLRRNMSGSEEQPDLRNAWGFLESEGVDKQ